MKVIQRPAVSMILVVVILVVVVLAAGVGYYFLAAAPGSSSTTSSSGTLTTSSSAASSTPSSTNTAGSTTPTQSSTTQSTSGQTSTQSTTGATTATCTATTTGTGNPQSNALAVIQQFQAMHIQYSVTNSTGFTINYTENMDVVRVTSTAYFVNVTTSNTEQQGLVFSYQFKVEKTGTVDWGYTKVSGYVLNQTTFVATSIFQGDMATFELELTQDQVFRYALLSQYFHQTGGTNTLSLTNEATSQQISVDYQTYVLNSTPESFGYCGNNFQFSQFNIEIGTIHGTSVQVLASYSEKGTVNGNYDDFTVTLTWVWLEPS